jgi:recombination protein RecR
MIIPKAIQNLIESFEKLPGVGPKTAQRLTFYLLHVPQIELDKFSSSLINLKTGTNLCSVCFMIDETNPCSICEDQKRDHSILCVVEEPLDVLALEKGRGYNGIYHVLHGRIDPLNSIGPDEIYIPQLLKRIKESDNIKEVILATNPTMEGEATAMYLAKQIKSQIINPKSQIKITRIGRGLPVGADLEYADEVTLKRAMDGRSDF